MLAGVVVKYDGGGVLTSCGLCCEIVVVFQCGGRGCSLHPPGYVWGDVLLLEGDGGGRGTHDGVGVVM